MTSAKKSKKKTKALVFLIIFCLAVYGGYAVLKKSGYLKGPFSGRLSFSLGSVQKTGDFSWLLDNSKVLASNPEFFKAALYEEQDIGSFLKNIQNVSWNQVFSSSATAINKNTAASLSSAEENKTSYIPDQKTRELETLLNYLKETQHQYSFKENPINLAVKLKQKGDLAGLNKIIGEFDQAILKVENARTSETVLGYHLARLAFLRRFKSLILEIKNSENPSLDNIQEDDIVKLARLSQILQDYLSYFFKDINL